MHFRTYIIGILAAGIALTSCKKSFINLTPISNQTSTTFFKTAADFQQGVNAIYDGLQKAQAYGRTYYYLMEVRSDNTDIFDRGANAGVASQVDLFTELTSNTFISDGFAGSYVIISRANAVLDQVDNASFDDGLKKQYKGEALFLRALTYFNLVRIWGKVPLIIKTETTSESFADKRNDVADVYTQIESDLTTAAGLLPKTYSSNDLGRATSGSANALLGKVYVALKRWSDAQKVLQPILADYALLTNYADLFKPENVVNSEMIFAVRYKKGQSPLEGNSYFNDMMPTVIYLNGTSLSGSYNNRPTMDLVKAYEKDDKRFSASLDTVYFKDATSTVKGNWIKKYADIPAAPNDAGSNFPVLRYADVLLLMAEALNEQGYDPSAAEGHPFYYLNKVRQRAGIPDKLAADITSQDAFRDAIFKERRVELAFENDRWFDIIRYSKGLQTMQSYLLNEYALTTPVLTTDRLLFPIPQREIDVHNDPANFPQNPGYQ